MTTTDTRTKVLTAAVSAVIATMATPALLALGAGTAQATPAINERIAVSATGDLPIPAVNPVPEPPSDPDSSGNVGLGGPDTNVGTSGPTTKVDGGTRIGPLSPADPGRASSSLNPGEMVGIILHG